MARLAVHGEGAHVLEDVAAGEGERRVRGEGGLRPAEEPIEGRRALERGLGPGALREAVADLLELLHGEARLALQGQGWQVEQPAAPIYLAALGDAPRRAAFLLLARLRRRGLAADMDYLGRSLKAQMKEADRLGSATVVVIGDDELARGVVILRDMTSGEQRQVPAEQAPALLSGEREDDR